MRRRKLTEGTAATAGLAADRLDLAVTVLREAVAAGSLPGAVLLVGRRGTTALRIAVGRLGPEADARALRSDDVFLVASLTKPIVCLTILMLLERGALLLDDPAQRYLPEMSGDGAERILIRHLLTHTSGLPDMLPNDRPLREAQAPLAAFVEHACRLSPEFEPGTSWQYQSMGILLLAEIAERLCGRPMVQLLADMVLVPLGLRSSFLGLREGYDKRLVQVDLPREQRGTQWHWNTDYWRRFAAPWGGLHSTADDLAVLLQTMLNGGAYGDVMLLSEPACQAALADQTALLPDLPDDLQRRHRWGFGWCLGAGLPGWPELVSSTAFGHTGATGTMFWADPESEILVVLLTNQPGHDIARLRARVGTVIAAART